MAKTKEPPHQTMTLSKVLPIFREIENDSDRAVGIVAVSLVENNLSMAILTRLRPLDVEEQKKLFEGQNALLNTFDARIQMADALGIVSGNSLTDLRALKRIRNLFAHEMEIRSFENKAIKPICEALMYARYCEWSLPPKNKVTARKKFEATAHGLAARFDSIAHEHVYGGKKPLIHPPEAAAYESWKPE